MSSNNKFIHLSILRIACSFAVFYLNVFLCNETLMAQQEFSSSKQSKTSEKEISIQKRNALIGRFVFDGEIPKPKSFFRGGKLPLIDQSLNVSSDNKGIKDVLVLLKEIPLNPKETFRDNSKKYGSERAIPWAVGLTILDKQFSQPLVVLQPSQFLLVRNWDKTSVELTFLTSRGYTKEVVPPGGPCQYKPNLDNRTMTRITSDNNPLLRAHIHFWDTPYFNLSKHDGTFKIESIPVGKYQVQIFHLRGIIEEITRDGETQTWDSGRFELDIEAEENDLGEIFVAPSNFGIKPKDEE